MHLYKSINRFVEQFKTKTMKPLKKYKATYKRSDVDQSVFKAENLEDAIRIADLKCPKGFFVSNVLETTKSVLHPLFEDIARICKPKDTIYHCEDCDYNIKESNVIWKNDTPVCCFCDKPLKL